MKAVILARVSTKEQEEGHSIHAQKERLLEYCKKNGLKVIKIYEIIESSTQGERKKFNNMISFIESSKEKIAIVADAVDRVQRSFKESIVLDDLRKKEKIEIHFLRESIVLNENSKSFQILMWDFATMGAKSYVLALSDNVKRSIEYKIRNGEWIGKAPVGYLNSIDPITGKKTVIVDNERAYLVRKGFELYSTGNYSIRQITKMLKKDGLTNNTKINKPLTNSQIHKMLQNPFYFGLMRIKGNLYPHKYEPIIDEFLFNKCQKVRNNRQKKPFKYASKPFIFRGLIKCDYCGCSITTDRKKDKYNYLCCTKYKGNCNGERVREEELVDQIKELLKNLIIPEEVLIDLKERLQKSQEAKKLYHKESIENLRKDYDKIQTKLDNLLDMRLGQSITQSEYDKKAYELKQTQYELEAKLKKHTEADEKFSITVNYLLNLASRAYELFESSKIEQKRQLINFLLSNLRLRGKTLLYDCNKPFDAILNANKCSNWLPE
ncbi:MAG TPA: recombinase family protein [Actinobacteria bacterium]|nr:recombinase family protein [Actinomycetota bacterium]